MNIAEALQYTAKILENAGIISSILDAQILLAYVFKTEKYKLLTDNNKKLSMINLLKLYALIRRRLKGEPVAYITGKKEFYSIDFTITKHVLIPRPETERIVELAILSAKKNSTVLDIGTGSGAIAIALKKNRPDLTIYACDISRRALKLAKFNAEKNLIENTIIFRKSNLFQSFYGEKFDLILSNPPYLSETNKKTLQKEIFFEPEKALFTDDNGKKILTKIISESKNYLHNTGFLILEIGNDQDTYVKMTGEKFNFSVSIIKDYSDFPRYAVLR